MYYILFFFFRDTLWIHWLHIWQNFPLKHNSCLFMRKIRRLINKTLSFIDGKDYRTFKGGELIEHLSRKTVARKVMDYLCFEKEKCWFRTFSKIGTSHLRGCETCSPWHECERDSFQNNAMWKWSDISTKSKDPEDAEFNNTSDVFSLLLEIWIIFALIRSKVGLRINIIINFQNKNYFENFFPGNGFFK